MPLEQDVVTKEDVYGWLKAGESLEYANFNASHLGGVKLSKISLKGVSLEGADLRYAYLAGAILEDANLKGADLRGAKLSGANLAGANLEGAHLDNAYMVRANLSNASFKDATLTYASLRSTNVNGANFTGADLRGMNLWGAEGCLAAKFDGANLCGARLDNTWLDVQDLKAVRVKTDNYTKGLKNKVFNFFKVEEEQRHSNPIKRFFLWMMKNLVSMISYFFHRKKTPHLPPK